MTERLDNLNNDEVADLIHELHKENPHHHIFRELKERSDNGCETDIAWSRTPFVSGSRAPSHPIAGVYWGEDDVPDIPSKLVVVITSTSKESGDVLQFTRSSETLTGRKLLTTWGEWTRNAYVNEQIVAGL